MLSVEEAKKILMDAVPLPETGKMKVQDSLGYVLAADLLSPIDVPLFDQSAVDGYAICFDRNKLKGNVFTLTREIKAGDAPILKMKINTAVRIFTGAPVPSNANCVVMQEKVNVAEQQVEVIEEFLKEGSNIRRKGNQIRKGGAGLKKGITLSPAAIGFLNTIGCSIVKVFKKPRIGILVTGNELVKAGNKLKPGQIYESNSGTLESVLLQSGYKAGRKSHVKDEKKLVLSAVKKLLANNDVLIISGGISVGKYDFVKEVLAALKVKELFYKVAQKPGKPLFVGMKGRKIVFAVPGNPAAALVCYYQYILPTLDKLSGKENLGLEKVMMKSNTDYTGKGDRSLFLKSLIENGGVSILDGQDSDNLLSFSGANSLVYLPIENLEIRRGDAVEVFKFPSR